MSVLYNYQTHVQLDIFSELILLSSEYDHMWRVRLLWGLIDDHVRDMPKNTLMNIIQFDWINTLVRTNNFPDDFMEKWDERDSISVYMSASISAFEKQLKKVKDLEKKYGDDWVEVSTAIALHNEDHLSESETAHFVPGFRTFLYYDNTPTFQCNVCPETSKAPFNHSKICGKDNSVVAGCGDNYYTCSSNHLKEHGVVYCAKKRTYKKNGDWIKETCGLPFRKCSNNKFNHHTGIWGSSKHSENVLDHDGEPPPLSWPPVDDEEDEEDLSSPGLYPVDASYITIDGEEMVDTAPGDTVSVDLVMPADKGYAMLYWYLAGPGETGLGDEIGGPDYPSASGIETEVSYSFSMPSDASGVYTFTAYIYPHSSASDQTVYTYSFKIYCS